MRFSLLLTLLSACGQHQAQANGSPPKKGSLARNVGQVILDKSSYVDSLISNMTVEDLVLQLHLMFGGDIVGVESKNELYDYAMRFSPDSPIGAMHDWYPLNTSHYNSVQALTLQKARLKIPLMHVGECLHGVGSFKQSMFPQSLGLSASFDTDLVYRVGRAIGTEARSIGIHACLSPVLDIGQDPRWGRMQEAWGEDKVLTSHMGVAYSSGLSKNGSWSEPDAVVPVLKHFAAHGAPQSGHNTAPFMGHGNRQVLQDLLTPFRAAIQLGGARGVLMAYSEFDDIPAHVHPLLYQALEDWGFDGFTIADDTGMAELQAVHQVADSAGSAIGQWFNAGGMIQFYDYPLEVYLNTTKDLVANGSVELTTLQSHIRNILGVKWDLGLFDDPFIPSGVNPQEIVKSHRNLTLEAAQRSIVLLENKNSTLPLKPQAQKITKIALVGPFADVLNYGDYSGQWGQYPADAAQTIRQGILKYANGGDFELVSSWGANTWEYNSQYVIPPYLLSANGTAGGLAATYFADTNFTQPMAYRIENPALDWGLYPPDGLPSNNFSAIWEGELKSPVDIDVDGWIGAAVGPNTTVKLFIDGSLTTSYGVEGLLQSSNIMGNIMSYDYITTNSTLPPTGSAPFTFRKGATYHIRIEYQAFTLYKTTENVNSLNSQLILFWNLVSRNGDAVDQAVQLASSSDVVVLAVGAAWNSDGENGDRGTLGLISSQDILAKELFKLGKPVMLVLQGGRPFAIDYYNQSAAVLSAFFPGQSGGQAIADVLFGTVNPGGRMPVTVPKNVGQLPVYYNYKPTAHLVKYLDTESSPAYWFGYGLSYTTFKVSEFAAMINGTVATEFKDGDTITFSATVRNNGTVDGSHVAQVYVLSRVSSIVQPVKQLVTFQRVDISAGEEITVSMELDTSRYLTILNRKNEWELEKGSYTFALLNHGGDTDTATNVTLKCV
ncbi:glycoside hydrolase family 3 protein [Annulohypoxylon truncatum]|uniref:glycoside hydrolase family 3 protein n=1 Tax=Annulohypoxylon truncatum TaxID=327061 RepID=UPI002007E24A|nr:glycoside hydrolase family 3 protein [Annulohypoxylon truncatum]KAI1206222.1 glycoside hydrolase family 3 protein [Annulohypoxylon truncatum]